MENKQKENSNTSKKLIYTREDFFKHQPKFYELPTNFYDIRALFKEPYKPEKSSESFNINKGEKTKARVKSLSKGDEREMLTGEALITQNTQNRRGSVIQKDEYFLSTNAYHF